MLTGSSIKYFDNGVIGFYDSDFSHKSDCRGRLCPANCPQSDPQLLEETELVLDPMVGSGTTLIEARLLNRNAIGYDINKKAVDITLGRLDFKVDNKSKQSVSVGDVRTLSALHDASVDLIIAHPPMQTS